MTEEDFDEECKSYAESKVEQNLIVQGIIDAEGLSLNDKETEELKDNLLLDYGAPSIDKLIEWYGEDEVNESLALLRVEKFIVDQSTVNLVEDAGNDESEAQDDTEEDMTEDNTVEE